MRPFVSTCVVVLAAGALCSGIVGGCSLDGFVFDLPDPASTGGGGASESSSSGSTSSSSSTSGSTSGGGSGMASSSSGGSSSSSSSSTSGGPIENCLNGTDDDSDGAVDCDDSDCGAAGYACVPDPANLPNGWMGPVVLFDGDPNQAPGCPGSHPTLEGQGNTGLGSPNVTCNACSCTGVSIDCVYPGLAGYTDVACANSAGVVFSDITGTMCGAASANNLLSFHAKSPVANVTGCAPTGGGVQNAPPATWKGAARICSGSSFGTCSAMGQVCAQPPPAPFGGKQCLVRAGGSGVPCPAPFTARHDIFDPNTLSDGRDCSACSCTPPDQFGCQIKYSLYSDASCMNSVAKIDANDQCVAPAASVSAASYDAAVSTSGVCASTGGGQPTGNFSATKTFTVCCLP